MLPGQPPQTRPATHGGSIADRGIILATSSLNRGNISELCKATRQPTIRETSG